MLSADKSSVTAEKREHWELLHMLSVRWSNENFVGGGESESQPSPFSPEQQNNTRSPSEMQ